MAESKFLREHPGSSVILKTAVKTEVKEAQTEAKTGDVKTQDTDKAPSDQPTGARSRR